MPFSFDRSSQPPKTGKVIKSAFDSEIFDADGTIHVDGLVGSATISPSGRDVALASPEGLAIIDLDSPWSPPRRLSSHGLPWLVVDVQWSPFAARDYWVASTANHRCLVWNLNKRDDSSSGAVEHSLQAHRRAITDINFSAHHPDSLATCAVDGYVHCWDLRRPRYPALTFCDWFAGATQVKYSRQDPNVLASAHDRYLHIWDNRKTAEPLKTIIAHTSKIYGIDWNRTEPTCIVTCSLDKSIKFWDYAKEDDALQRVIRTDFPVWRARHTPFGSGLLAMPQNEPGNLYLYDRRFEPTDPVDSTVAPVYVFPGHGNHKVKEFLWRGRGGVSKDGIDNRDFQLVTWGEDNELRLQKPEPRVLESAGYVRGTPLMKNLILTRKGAAYKTFRTVDDVYQRDRRSPTMSDPRPGTGSQFRPSALSMGLHTRARRIGPSWRATSMKAKTNSGKTVDKSQLQIGWMRGITISKRKSRSGMRPDSPDARMFGHTFDSDWLEPETIQDEFLRISSRLPNVEWENIDMDSLTLKASLKGPWGVDQSTIFIKVKVDIPSSYPKSKAPKFYIDKTSFMPEETHTKLQHELQELSNRFLERKENCLFVAFTYLLGEVDLENSTTYFKNVRDLDDDMDGLADESSSEEDESDIPAGGSASMSQELWSSTELDPTATLASTQRPILPPPPRLCGARFSNDGKLVCFFPTKEERQKALFTLPAPDVSGNKQKGEPTFDGFGRLPQDSPPPKHRFNDETSATDDQSDDSDDTESTSSTDSEPTTVHKLSLWYQPGRYFRKPLSTNESVRSSGGGTGAGTGTGTGTSRRRPGKPKNFILIHDLGSELPSKKQLAEEYAIFGDGSDVCSHNASVADKYGYSDLANIWRYAALLLTRDIPLEVQYNRRQSILVIARESVARSKNHEHEASLAGRVKWGYHPLARDLIDDLFDYFEKMADIQMLAMLTCIFGDSFEEDGVAYAESRLTQPETPLPMKAPSFSLEYFPTDPGLWNVNYRSQASSAVGTPRIANTPAWYSDSQASEDVMMLAKFGAHSYSYEETPPKLTPGHIREARQTQSLSTSPNNRAFYKPNSTVASIAASLPRTLAGMVSGSPPDPPARKRPSPAGTILSNFTPSAITWGSSTVFGAGPSAPETTPGTARTSLLDDDRVRDDFYSMVPIAVRCVPENQGLFDDDGWMSVPLIEPRRRELYTHYRYAYAEMLQMWEQSLSRLEILKFNVLKDERFYNNNWSSNDSDYTDLDPTPRGSRHYPTGASSPVMGFGGRREQFKDLLATGRGLDVTGICRIHEIQLEPVEYSRPTNGHVGGAVGICPRCFPENAYGSKVPQTQLHCVYCLEPVASLYPPCLSCGCVSHASCLAEWHAMGETECPAGDECNCVEEALSGQVESWSALQAAISHFPVPPSPVSSPPQATAPSRAMTTSEKTIASLKKAVGVGSSNCLPARSRRKSAPTELSRFQLETGVLPPSHHHQAPMRPSLRRMQTNTGSYAHNSEDETSYPAPAHSERESGDWENIISIPSVTITSASNNGSSGSSAASTATTGSGFLAAMNMGYNLGIGGGYANKPPVQGDEPISAARLSLGNRLKKSLHGSAASSISGQSGGNSRGSDGIGRFQQQEGEEGGGSGSAFARRKSGSVIWKGS
ncbi:hypothetical protein QBC40DRAFT_72439 [Triangularia verruculosa]|uniref:RWD domain-containing protein n=1 Tax=Triangularia verruculosa TaxID=2587418 RepID=A0AAN6XJ90_9PEZI|nr:hypothetical protein QBC40DRAFT_72439 [Triangularia verruculosa]